MPISADSTIKLGYYEVLGVSHDASDDDIKNAFKHLAEVRRDDKAEAELKTACEVLLDSGKRVAYDLSILLDEKDKYADLIKRCKNQKKKNLHSPAEYKSIIAYCDAAFKKSCSPYQHYQLTDIQARAFFYLKDYQRARELNEKSMLIVAGLLNLTQEQRRSLCMGLIVQKIQSLYFLKKWQEMLLECNKVLNYPKLSDKNKVRVLYKKGRVLEQTNEFKEAVQCYDQVLKLNPDYVFAKRHKEDLVAKMNLFAPQSAAVPVQSNANQQTNLATVSGWRRWVCCG